MNDLSYSSKDAVKDKIINKKSSKNKKIIFFSMLGLGSLTVAVSLPFGFLNDFRIKPAEPEDTNPIDTSKPISNNNPTFTAWYVKKWANLYLSDIDINLSSSAINSDNKITLDNLWKIGIKPTMVNGLLNESYKNWVSVKSSPIKNISDGFQISIVESPSASSPFVYKVHFVNSILPAIKPSPFYTVHKVYADNTHFFPYPALLFKNLSDFYLTYTQLSEDPLLEITVKNLEKIGIVPRDESYKLWEFIKLFPTSATTVKVSIKIKGEGNLVEYDISDFDVSSLYNKDKPVPTTNKDFIMYTPYNWENLYPIQGQLTLSSNKDLPLASQISLSTLEKIGIVPTSIDYTTWTSVTIDPLKSGTCKIVIKKDNGATEVANFEATGFRKGDTYSATILKSSSTKDFNFIWYRPNAWANNVWPNDITLNLDNQNMSLEKLESIGIVPLDESYLRWTSIKKDTLSHGTQGKFSISITSSNNTTPLEFQVTGLKTSSIYDASKQLSIEENFVRYQPIAFQGITSPQLTNNYLNINFSGTSLTVENLEKFGIVSLVNNLNWISSFSYYTNLDNYSKMTYALTYKLPDGSNGSTINLTYDVRIIP